MKKNSIMITAAAMCATALQAQLSPAITSWLQNTTKTGSYYTAGNSTTQANNILVNCQKVEYTSDFVFVTATGIPSYPTGPFQDGNPSNASNQNGIYKFPLNPTKNTGTATETSGGNIGIFINGVALFDYRDGVGWNSTTNSLCGGPGNPPCPGGPMAGTPWSRDALPAEKPGFDCSKGHPAMGNYHHHQNPSAFKLDKTVISTVCNLYDADGLYAIDSSKHSPLIGYAYDGFPIYGAFGYKNIDGFGNEITRMKSGWSLRNITVRTHHADGTDVADGPAISSTYPIGYFKDDYEFISSNSPDVLDEHNGRFCKTPEYPNGTYAYFATVDANWNSAYPYVVGPTFYGNTSNRKVTTIDQGTTIYTPTNASARSINTLEANIFPNPSIEIVAIQLGGIVTSSVKLELLNMSGQVIYSSSIEPGQTIGYINTQTYYPGTYLVKLSGTQINLNQKVIISNQ